MAHHSPHQAPSTLHLPAHFHRQEMLDSSLHSALMSVSLNYGQFKNSVWQGSYAENVTISFETLVRKTFDMFSEHFIDLPQRHRLAADFVVGLLQAAGHQEDVVQQNSQQMQVEENVSVVNLKAEVKEEEVCLSDVDLDEVNQKEGELIPPEDRHNVVLTKNVPKEVVYGLRGVRCRVCGHFLRGPECLEEQIRHTKLLHPLQATPQHIRLIRFDNSVKNLIGGGVPYCTCRICRRLGPAAFDKSLPALSLVRPKRIRTLRK